MGKCSAGRESLTSFAASSDPTCAAICNAVLPCLNSTAAHVRCADLSHQIYWLRPKDLPSRFATAELSGLLQVNRPEAHGHTQVLYSEWQLLERSLPSANATRARGGHTHPNITPRSSYLILCITWAALCNKTSHTLRVATLASQMEGSLAQLVPRVGAACAVTSGNAMQRYNCACVPTLSAAAAFTAWLLTISDTMSADPAWAATCKAVRPFWGWRWQVMC